MTNQLPIPVQEYATRLARTQELMAKQGLDGLVVLSGNQAQIGHVSYLTNHRPLATRTLNHLAPGYAAYVLLAQGAGVLVAPGGYDLDGVVNIDSARTGLNLAQEIVAAVKGYGGKGAAWGLAGMDVIPARTYLDLTRALSSLEWQGSDALLEGQRLIKSETEIALLTRAARISAEGLAGGAAAAIPGASRRDVELAVRGACLRAGADLVADVGVSTGPRLDASQWLPSSAAILDEGDFVSLTVSGWARGYAFELSRASVAGLPSAEQGDYLAHLAEATAWMLSRMLPGKRITYYPAESRAHEIESLAHGIGLEPAEKPWVRERKPFVPQSGMVLCVAPVVASKAFGRMTIKEMVAIRDAGPQVLGQV